MKNNFTISFVIPAYNEEKNLSLLAEKIIDAVNNKYAYEIIFVDDGSTDNTMQEINSLRLKNPNIHCISFSKNFGHQHALKAGIDYFTGDAVIMMDADLQHPPHLIDLLIEKWSKENYDVVYTVRNDNKSNLSFFKRATSSIFYRIMNKLSDINIEPGAADFRLLDKKIAAIISETNDPFLFLRGLIPWLGFRQYKIVYTPENRHSGTTKYSNRKMIAFAVNGITSFSVKPLRLAVFFGLIISMLAFFYALYAVAIYFFDSRVISGWASLLTSVLFIGGIQLLMIGIIGEYIGKIYMHLKNRPNYIIKENTKLK